MTVRRPRRRIVAALLLWSVWCGQDAGTTALIPTGLMRAIGSIPKAAGWAEKYTEVPDFPLQKVSVMNPERSAKKHAQKLTNRILWGGGFWQIVGRISGKRAPIKNMILPFTEELEGAQNDTLFERLMVDVLEDSVGGTSAVFAEPGIGKSVASVLAAQKTNASQSRLTVVLQGAFEESLETFFRVQKASQAPKVARSMFKMLADHGVRLQIVFDNTFDNEVPEQSKAPMRDLTRFAFVHGHHLIVICQTREGAESVDDLNGVRTRIAAQQNGRCAEEFRWSEKLAENYLNATVMSELKARGRGLERYADVMREWLNGTKVRDQFGGWNPTIMSLYVRRMCKLGEDVPREARAAPRGPSAGSAGATSTSSVVWVRELIRKEDGIVTAKLRPKEEGFQGEDEPEQAFKVQSREGAQLNDV
eukprot:CAMPEP_0181412228 /NCGR_PEP_ID=MMETSP1110-20121109/8311_1 /TAXON_ID=174948 /ORGANISM="Symbiodinium sp., Strain CCMP421" /LENGTH=418 /DNA_ID=CAMNT_0023534929 /DNA_START=82 /DNA_END=1334 /DNA_ORIENTATION=-